MSELVENIWHLRMQADPFVQANVHGRLPVGLSLSDAVAELGAEPEQVEFFIDGHHIPRGAWPFLKPRSGIVVEARGVPGGPVAGVIAAIASAWGTAAFTVAGVAITWGQIAGLAISFGLQILASSMFAPQTASTRQRQEDPVYSISGARNQMRPWQAVPIVMGTHRMVPPYGAAPYTEVIGREQYLRFVVVWGYGPVEVSDIRIGNTPIGQFEGVEIEHDWTGAGDLALYPNTVSQQDLGVEITPGTGIIRNTEPDTDEILATVVLPNGLIRYRDSDGSDKPHNLIIYGYYRVAGSGDPWTLFYYNNYYAETTEPIYLGARWRFATRGEYEIRFTRTAYADGSSTYVEELQWANLKSVKHGDPINAPGIAKTAIRIKATDQLSGVIDTVNGLVKRKVLTWVNSAWTTTTTRNPAFIFRDVLKGAANARPVTDSAKVDDETIRGWASFCSTKGLAYNNVINTQRPLREVLDEIAAAGMASVVLKDDVWSVIIDQAQTTIVQHFTPRNTWGFSGAISFPEQPHALRVEFANADVDFEADEIIVYDDGYSESNATKFELIAPGGVTTSGHAYKIGRHVLASGRLRPELFTFSVDFENLIAQVGDLVRITHDVALIGQAAGRVKSVAGTTVTLDDFVTTESGTTYTLRVRGATGDTITTTVAGTGTTGKSVTVASATGIAAGDLWMFGEADEESIIAIVKAIEPGDDLTATISCIPYNEDVYNSAQTIPAYQSVVSAPVTAAHVGPPAPVILSITSDEGALPKSYDGVPVPTILVRLTAGESAIGNPRQTATTGFLVDWRKTGTGTAEIERVSVGVDGTARITNVDPGEAYDIGALAFDAIGNTSAYTYVGGHIVAGLNALPNAVDTFRVANRAGNAYVEWTYPSISSDVVGYEIRWHADQGVTSWSRMTRIATDIPRAARSFMVPSNTGSYAIKPFDVLGNRAENALYVSSNISDPADTNVVLSFTETSSFAGTMDGVVESSGRLQLDSALLLTDISDLSTVTDIAGDVVEEGTYTFWSEQDIGGVFSVNVGWELEVDADNRRNYVDDWEDMAAVSDLSGGASYGDEYDVEMQISTSRDDVASGMTWSAYERFIPGEFTARHFRFRMVLKTTDPLISPSVDDFAIQIDVPDRVERGEDVSSGTSTYSVSFGAAFLAAPNVTIAAQDLQTGDYYAISNKSATGFDVDFYNSSATAVSRTFDWQAIGFGKEAA